MSRWWRFDSEILNDPTCQRLTARQFKRELLFALSGAENCFSKFVRVTTGRPCHSEWKQIRRRIFQRDDYTCAYCGVRGHSLECDHIHPVSRGGLNDDDNLTTACKKCNQSKKNKTLQEWGRA